jgi:hypothetical protein
MNDQSDNPGCYYVFFFLWSFICLLGVFVHPLGALIAWFIGLFCVSSLFQIFDPIPTRSERSERPAQIVYRREVNVSEAVYTTPEPDPETFLYRYDSSEYDRLMAIIDAKDKFEDWLMSDDNEDFNPDKPKATERDSRKESSPREDFDPAKLKRVFRDADPDDPQDTFLKGVFRDFHEEPPPREEPPPTSWLERYRRLQRRIN